MAFTFHPCSVRALVLKLGPKHLVPLDLPQEKELYHDKLNEFVKSNCGLLESRIVELRPGWRAQLSERYDWVKIQAFLKGKQAKVAIGSWETLMKGPTAKMHPICRRLYNGEKTAKDASTCRTDGEKRDYRSRCDQCYENDLPFRDCVVLEGSFGGACANCVLCGRRKVCTARDKVYGGSKKGRVKVRGKTRGYRGGY
ncbi:hypothetical protein NM208_g6470 [Fusarium decemcellulare]|uniref:Uncharacterized protein n=1 Tax=Fusarium decemcellulare TaxID=57161 RepID=A0ACC1SD19_9HYPO|nr:hypothetical protein NM208_g6470 [Fusarium decemcellulare]